MCSWRSCSQLLQFNRQAEITLASGARLLLLRRLFRTHKHAPTPTHVRCLSLFNNALGNKLSWKIEKECDREWRSRHRHLPAPSTPLGAPRGRCALPLPVNSPWVISERPPASDLAEGSKGRKRPAWAGVRSDLAAVARARDVSPWAMCGSRRWRRSQHQGSIWSCEKCKRHSMVEGGVKVGPLSLKRICLFICNARSV